MTRLSWKDPIGADDEPDFELPPVVSPSRERRLHMQALEWWSALNPGGGLPAQPCAASLGAFADSSVVLHLADGEVPRIGYVGERLRAESGLGLGPVSLAAVPPGSMLSRLLEHAATASTLGRPISFEAEATSLRGSDILYRGVLLPFANGSGGVDQVLGVMNWKEYAPELIERELLRALGAIGRPDLPGAAPVR